MYEHLRRNKVPEYFVRDHEARAQGIGYLIKLKGPTRKAKNIYQYAHNIFIQNGSSIILTETKTKELIPRLKIVLLKSFHHLIILLSDCFGNYLFFSSFRLCHVVINFVCYNYQKVSLPEQSKCFT